MYETSQHSIITRKAAFPQSAGACKTSTQTGADLMERKKSAGRLQETSPHNPIVLRPGSLTPVELTPPTSASTIRKPASLSNYPPFLDFSFQSLLDFSAPRPVQLLANYECEVTCMHDYLPLPSLIDLDRSSSFDRSAFYRKPDQCEIRWLLGALGQGQDGRAGGVLLECPRFVRIRVTWICQVPQPTCYKTWGTRLVLDKSMLVDSLS